jgi:predicted nucleic acid-binding protein
MRLPLATTAAVLAELFHLVGDSRREVAAAWALLRSGAIALSPIDDADLPALDALMARYHDRPMDFADATLVHVARRESVTTIFTIDHDDFETYRIDGRKRFRIVPDRLPARRR